MITSFHQKPNLYISHVQLKVSNLANSIHFYTSILGFKILKQEDSSVYLTVDGTSSLVSLIEVKKNIDPNHKAGLYHIALLLPSRNDLGNILRHFVDNQVRIGAGDHHVSEALYLNDPDGNGIEIYADRPKDEWKWLTEGQIYMTTEQVDFHSVLADSNKAWDGLPSETVIGHVHLAVNHLKKAEHFYTSILDYDVVTSYGSQALFISTGRYHHHIGMNTWHSAGADVTSKDEVGLAFFTIVLKDEGYAQDVRQKLEDASYAVQTVIDPHIYEGMPLFSVRDSSGIEIRFTIEG